MFYSFQAPSLFCFCDSQAGDLLCLKKKKKRYKTSIGFLNYFLLYLRISVVKHLFPS